MSVTPGRYEVTAATIAKINGYRPMWSTEDLVLWDEVIGDIARLACIKLLEAGIDRGFDQLRYLAGLALSVYKRRGVTDLNLIVTPDEVERWIVVDNSDKTQAWRHVALSFLRNSGPLLAPMAPWRPPGPQVGGMNGVHEPYDDFEVDAYVRLALGSTGKRAPRLCAAVGCVFGAGLDGRSLPWLEVSDVVELGGGRIALSVRRPEERLVPVRAAFTDMIRTAADRVGDGPFLRGSVRNAGLGRRWTQMSEIWKLLTVEGIGQINPARARNTWITAHLRHGTPLPTLLRISGASGRLVADLASSIDMPEPDDAFTRALDV